ncbi:MAG: class I tRNA ligase family protein, partial [Actinomycetota bacterium]
VLNPDELIHAHGADVSRLALLFGRPWDDDGDFNPSAVQGVERFLGKVWRLVLDGRWGEDGPAVDWAVSQVTTRIDEMRFHTALSALMELVAVLRRDGISDRGRRTLVLLLAPLAPYVAEELWSRLGQPFSVHTCPWPAPTA